MEKTVQRRRLMFMQTATMTFNELDWRSDAARASAGKVLSSVATQSKAAYKHYAVLRGIGVLNEKMLDLIKLMHSPELRTAIELASATDLAVPTEKLRDLHGKVRITVAQIRCLIPSVGFWKPFYSSRLQTLEAYNTEIVGHADAFAEVQSSLIMLSERDQELVLATMENPPAPNDALRRAFARK
jgi:Protein of unknown function (DUF1778)